MDAYAEYLLEEIVPITLSVFLMSVSAIGRGVAKQKMNIMESAVELTAGKELLEHMSALKDGESTVPLAAVRGRVIPLNPGDTVSNSSNMGAVIQTKVAEENYIHSPLSFGGINSWMKGYSETPVELNSVPFGLVDVNRNNYSNKEDLPTSAEIIVVDNGGTTGYRDGLLVNVKSELTLIEPSVMKLVLGFITGSYTTSLVYEEKILPVNSVITVFGEISKMSNGQLRITQSDAVTPYVRPFILTMSTAKDIKARYKFYEFLWILAFAFSVGVFTGSVGFACYRWWARGRLRRAHGTVVAARNNNDNPIEGLTDLQICVVCRGRPREVLLIPCGHVCLCADCCLRLNYKCPVCQTPFTDVHPAYIS